MRVTRIVRRGCARMTSSATRATVYDYLRRWQREGCGIGAPCEQGRPDQLQVFEYSLTSALAQSPPSRIERLLLCPASLGQPVQSTLLFTAPQYDNHLIITRGIGNLCWS